MSTNEPPRYPNVPLPDGKLYTDVKGWREYAKLVNDAAGEVLAGYGVACPCSGKAMLIGPPYVLFECSECRETLDRKSVCEALGIPYRTFGPMRSTVG